MAADRERNFRDNAAMPSGLAGARIVCLESRRATEIAKLVQKQGGEPISAPSMREVPLSAQAAALSFADVLQEQRLDALVLLTGVGARMLIDALATRLGHERVVERLQSTPIFCRGPKPHAVLKSLNVESRGVAAEPNTWRELLELMNRTLALRGARIYVQEYGRSTPELLSGLQDAGAIVQTIAVYAWALPEDLGPLENAVHALATGHADGVVFTSGQQAEHLLAVAERLNLRGEVLGALQNRTVVASIGPVTSEVLAEHGIPVDVTPDHPKMGHLISTVAKRWGELVARKGAGGS